MRHLLSLLFGLVIAPAVWLATGYGQARLVQETEEGLTFNGATIALAVLAGAGLVYGLVAATRISPLGPLVAGLLLIGGQLAYVARPEQITELLPQRVLGVDGVFTLPAATGVATVLGACVLMALFSIGRWRRWPKFEPPEDPFLSDAASPIGAPSPVGARQSFDDERTMAHSFGGPPPPEEQTRAFTGTPAANAEPRYEPFGYVSDEPPRQAPPWPNAPEPPWRPPAGDYDEPDQTGRLPGPGAGGPWMEPPRR